MNFQDAINDLQTLDVQRPGTWPTWVHFAAAILTAALLVGVGTYFQLMPMKDELNAARAKETVRMPTAPSACALEGVGNV